MCLTLIATALLLAFNILLGLSGIAMAVIGILLLVSPNLLLDVFKDIDLPNYPDLSEEFKIEGLVDLSDILKGSSVTLITLGAVIMVLALAGTCSSICGGLCRLVYSAFLCFIVVSVVAFIIYQSSREGKEDFKGKIFRALNVTFESYRRDFEKVDNSTGQIEIKNESMAWFYYQTEKSCCGITNYSDYNGNVPLSCCQLINQTNFPKYTKDYTNHEECTKDNSTVYLNIQGCLDAVYSEFMTGPQLGIILSAVTLPFLVGCLILSTYLMG